MSDDTLLYEELSHEEAHQVSVGLLHFMMENDIEPVVQLAAVMMTLGRVACPRVLEAQEEVDFVNALSEYVSLYFMTGEPQ